MSATHHASMYAIILMWLSSCSVTPDSETGINGREREILRSIYYWKNESQTSQWNESRLKKLMTKSLDQQLDGEYSESHTSNLMNALAEAGDERFAETLSKLPAKAQKAVIERVHLAWDRHGLSYPKTQLICENLARTAKPDFRWRQRTSGSN